MKTAAEPLDLKPGDIVAEIRGAAYGSALGVVERIGRGRDIVAFSEGPERNSFYLAYGMSCNRFRARHGWCIRPLDAATWFDILKVGFSTGPCLPRGLERMETRARELRAYVVSGSGVLPDRAAG